MDKQNLKFLKNLAHSSNCTCTEYPYYDEQCIFCEARRILSTLNEITDTEAIRLRNNFKVEKNIEKRWLRGIPHHEKSIDLYNAISEIDYKYGNDALCLKSGGDGDNGEHLMYILDIYFECLDKEERI
ncbi:MAG: hypothetical protein ACOC2W_01860 [bacterium]